MNKEQYHKYLLSADWLIKKSKLVMTYLKQNWKIDCFYCASTDSLHIHHFSYTNIGNEQIEDERIWELGFLCKNCHHKWHFDKIWKKEQEELKNQLFLDSLEINK